MDATTTNIANVALSCAATVITICTPLAVAYVQAHTKNKLIAQAVQAGGGVAYSAMMAATAKGGVDIAAAKQAAIAQGVTAAQQIAGSYTIAAAETKVAGALGSLLAVDPTVSAIGASVATATAAPGGSAIAEASPAR